MIVSSFSARKVHGCYDFNFKFRPDINFLIGNNGTGKTTALVLMQAALSFDIFALREIKFSSLRVEVVKDMEEYSIVASSYPDKILFKINGEELEYQFSPLFITKDGQMVEHISPSNRSRHHAEDARLELIRSGGPVLRRFLQGRRPMFLGLERRLGRYQDDGDYREIITLDGHSRIVAAPQKKEILEGLDNCKALVESAFRQYRRASDGRVDRLLNIVVESTFEYIEFDPQNFNSSIYSGASDLSSRRQELEKFARDLGGSEKTSTQIEKFFHKMSVLAGASKSKDEGWGLEWLLNMAQIRRIQKVLEEMDRQKKSAEKFYAPIKEFCDTINDFFRHSRKELVVDAVGKIKITQNSSPVELSLLSSGEKQLLILMAHARFGSSKKSAFIVDEPEVSLHMRWQEMLVDALLKEGKNNQFIFATHSPEIVGYRTENCIRLG